MTLRTVVIGRELGNKRSLMEWFFSQTGEIRGYTGAIFTGATSKELAKVIRVIVSKPEIKGLLNVAGAPISKCDFLKLVKEVYGRVDINIVPFDDFHCDRSLDTSKMRSFGISIADYKTMIKEMREDESTYR